MLAVSFGLFSSDASWCLLLLWIPQGHLHIAQVPQGEQVQITQDSEVSWVSCQGRRARQSCTQCVEAMPCQQSLRSFLGERDSACVRWGDWDAFLVSLTVDDGVQ